MHDLLTHEAASHLFNVLLGRGAVQVSFEPSVTGVVCPSTLEGLTLFEYGLNMPIPMQDILADELGIGATMSFNRSPTWTFVPWSAVHVLVGEGGGLIVTLAEELSTDVADAPKPGLKLVT